MRFRVVGTWKKDTRAKNKAIFIDSKVPIG